MTAEAFDAAAAVRQYMGDEQQTTVAASVRNAVASDPDAEADYRAISARTGVPISAIRARPEQLRQRAMTQDVLETVQRFPSTAQLLADEGIARIAHDDTGVLTKIESAIGGIASYVMGATPRGGMLADLSAVPFEMARGVNGTLRALSEAAAPLFEPTGVYRGGANPAREAAAWFGRQAAAAGKKAEQIAGTPEGILEAGISSGVRSAGQSLAFFATGRPDLALAAMALTTGGTSYSVAAEGDLPPRSSTRA